MNKKKTLFSWWSKTSSGLDSLESRIQYRFKNSQLQQTALTHKSYANEHGMDKHNERLEFLGDAVFGLSVSDLLMEQYPLASEGDLSKMRSSLVNTVDLAEIALALQLDREIKMGTGEEKNMSQRQPRLLAGVLEALIGAVYLDGGYKKARDLVQNIMGKKIKKGPVNRDYKSILQEFLQKKFRKPPTYKIIKSMGLQHQRTFLIEVLLDDQVLGKGTGSSKKRAMQAAALEALKKFKLDHYLQEDE